MQRRLKLVEGVEAVRAGIGGEYEVEIEFPRLFFRSPLKSSNAAFVVSTSLVMLIIKPC